MRINLQMTRQNVNNKSLFQHFFKILSLYLEADPDPDQSEPNSDQRDKQDPEQDSHRRDNQDPDPDPRHCTKREFERKQGEKI